MPKQPERPATYNLSAHIFTDCAQRLAKSFADEKRQITNTSQAAPLYYPACLS
jgi:hypothetical protein